MQLILLIIGLIIGFVLLEFLGDYFDGIIPKQMKEIEPKKPEVKHRSFHLTKEH